MNNNKVFIFILLFMLSNIYVFASPFSFFTGGSEKDKSDREKKASELLYELINDGTLTQVDDNQTFIKLIGNIADNILISVYTNITPNIKNLILTNKYSTKNYLDSNIEKLNASSLIGRLISIFICIECIMLGIKSVLDSNGISIYNIISKIIHVIILIIFFMYLPIIAKTTINIFTYIAQVANADIDYNNQANNNLFYYMPSDVLKSLSFCKDILSIEKIRLGSYTIPTIIPHLTINLGELIVSIPFLYLLIVIVFWYVELFLILLSAYVVLPFCIFTFVELSSISKIIKSFILQGLKIFSGIFLANSTSTIIINVIQNLDGSLTSVSNTILFCIFMSIILFFILTKGPNVILSTITGDSRTSSSSLVSGAVGGAVGALSNYFVSNKKIVPPTPPFSPILSNPLSSKKSPSLVENQDKNTKQNNNDNVEKLGNSKTISKGFNYGEVTARPSINRMKAARTELENEGFSNISDAMIKERAIRDAKIEKLIKMEKNGFYTNDGVFNRPAFMQLQRIRNGEE